MVSNAENSSKKKSLTVLVFLRKKKNQLNIYALVLEQNEETPIHLYIINIIFKTHNFVIDLNFTLKP